jgi:hypothetical protein
VGKELEAGCSHVFLLAAKMTDELGCVGVVVDSKAGALPFYEKFGFKPRPVVAEMADTPTPLFLKIATIKKAFRSS